MFGILRTQLWLRAQWLGFALPGGGFQVTPKPYWGDGARGGRIPSESPIPGQATPGPQTLVAPVARSSWPQLTPRGLCYF